MRNPATEVFDLCGLADQHLRWTDYIDIDDLKMRRELGLCARTFCLVAEGAYETPPIPLKDAIAIAQTYNSTDQLPRMQSYPAVQQAAFLLMCASNRFEFDDHASAPELQFALS